MDFNNKNMISGGFIADNSLDIQLLNSKETILPSSSLKKILDDAKIASLAYGYWGDSYTPITETKKTTPKMIEEFIEKFNIEHDEENLYMYKAVTFDNFSPIRSQHPIKYEIGKTIVESDIDKNMCNLCAKGLHVCDYTTAKKYALMYLKNNNGIIINHIEIEGRDLTIIGTNDMKCKIIKVKIPKKYVVIPHIVLNGKSECKIRTSELEVLSEEIINAKDFKNEFTFKVKNITISNTNIYKYTIIIKQSLYDITQTFYIKSNKLYTETELDKVLEDKLNEMLTVIDMKEKMKSYSKTFKLD